MSIKAETNDAHGFDYSIRYVSNRGKVKIVHQADLTVQLTSTEFKLKLHPMHYDAGIEFLEKKPLKPFCSIRLLLEIKEENTDPGWIAGFLEGLK